MVKCDLHEAPKEPLNELDDDSALDDAIMDAAGLKDKEYQNLAVESIEVDNTSHSHNLQDHPEDSKTFEESNPDSSSSAATVSTILGSERKSNGAESVQITD